ncbi:F-box protein At3g07870-like [Zingiber officinale]|uniref:F-box domain-containing protein n=1 Tax=Zingiber officinale TaxID=94328 RepID=A0A8J5H366_ZINOF|nr:F-box protein At3g07870-like [Zingiber officinale]XP_042377937.1 F-box protein At3g07870-like [Zingiber officinale]KAG6515428.1 hypothetical protein ZIOFF_025840 [Zingiber officinale]
MEAKTTATGPSHDILFCILSRLPLKAVVRCCCVSKFWNHVIKSPEFRHLHSAQLPTDPDSKLLFLSRRMLRENVISISPMNLASYQLHISDNSISNLVSSLEWNLVGACNGFLCFASADHDCVLICNPITKEFVTLPKSTRHSPLPLVTAYGFGFDSASEKYKVVRLSYSKEPGEDDNVNQKVSAEVCTVGVTGSWRPVPDFLQPPYGLPVYASGFLHWAVHPFFFGPARIVSFDLGKEESVITHHPEFGLKFSIVELGGCLSVVDLRKPTLIEIWVLKDRSSNNWEQEYILPVGAPLGLDKRHSRLITISELDGVLLIWLQDAIFTYDRRTLSRKKMRIQGLPSWLDWEILCGYRPNLAPLRGDCERSGKSTDVAYFKSDLEICSQPAISSQIVDRSSGKRDGIISCFIKNQMLA